LSGKEAEIAKLEEVMSGSDFWDDRDKAQQVVQDLARLKEELGSFRKVEDQTADLEVWYQLSQEEGEAGESVGELVKGIKELKDKLAKLELELLLSGPYDKNNAIITLHPGAGGTESQDWAEMLYRMYTRWAEKRKFATELLDYLPGDEAGIKSVTLLVKGQNAYGYLKAEKGVHRLVRISPFDASGRRHTSFASADVIPEVEDMEEVKIDSADLKIDTYRAGGAGGQHVNKTDSAVRITHLPSGIVVQCQNERSQISNRQAAMKILTAKLVDRKLAEQEVEMANIRGEQQEIGWGSQIRSYVFHPYSLVKDHRTNVEVGNVDSVMDGQINQFMEAYLRRFRT
jgi:peptide chain release factor 2